MRVAGAVLHVPLTYREAPLDGAEESLVTTVEHSAPGRRWVYDACIDPVFWTTLCAMTLTGVGQSSLIEIDGRLVVRPPSV